MVSHSPAFMKFFGGSSDEVPCQYLLNGAGAAVLKLSSKFTTVPACSGFLSFFREFWSLRSAYTGRSSLTLVLPEAQAAHLLLLDRSLD